MLISKPLNFSKVHAGFSILEMAIVMVIVATLLGGLLVSISTTQELNNRIDTEGTLEEIKEALYGFAQANGYLPCPATAASAGVEAPVGGGVCAQRFGFVPWSTLGLSGPLNTDNLLMDSWLNPYRYSVSNQNASAFTTPGAMSTVGMATLAPDLEICDAAGCGTVLFDSAPAVILSMGQTGVRSRLRMRLRTPKAPRLGIGKQPTPSSLPPAISKIPSMTSSPGYLPASSTRR